MVGRSIQSRFFFGSMYLTQIDLETENHGEMRGHTCLVKFSKIRIYVKHALSNRGLNLRYLPTPVFFEGWTVNVQAGVRGWGRDE